MTRRPCAAVEILVITAKVADKRLGSNRLRLWRDVTQTTVERKRAGVGINYVY